MTEPARWPAEQVERRPTYALLPSAHNARTHSPAQVQELAASIRQFGWTIPVLIAEDQTIIAGHGRVLAAELLGLPEVPVLVARGWTEEQRRAYTLADNKLALNAEWDLGQLRAELAALQELAVDVTQLGFSAMEVQQLFAHEASTSTEWQGMPEFHQPNAMAFQSITVHFKDAEAVQEFAKRIGQDLGRTTRFTWFPFLPRENFRDLRYVTEPEATS